MTIWASIPANSKWNIILIDVAKEKQSKDQAALKKFYAPYAMLKHMLKILEVCKAQGFVYGIIL